MRLCTKCGRIAGGGFSPHRINGEIVCRLCYDLLSKQRKPSSLMKKVIKKCLNRYNNTQMSTSG